jgi:type IV secretion system protein VirB10
MPDQDNSFASRSVPEVQNKALKAPGIMPKNAQMWAIVGISAVMNIVIAFSSSGTPKPASKPVVADRQNVNPPNQRQVDQYKAMVDEEARRLALERQRLDQVKFDAQNAAAMLQSSQVPAGSGVQTYPTPQPAYGNREQTPEEAQRSALETEKRKREYLSLFSSNVSLTLRKDQNTTQNDATGTIGATDPISGQLQALNSQLNALRQTAGTLPPSIRSDPTHDGAEGGRIATEPEGGSGATTEDRRKSRTDDPILQQADGKPYRLFEGTVLEGVLTNRLSGSFSGPVNVMVTTNLYSHDHQQLLIPQGSRVLGEVQKVNSFGQQRLAVSFHRLIMPDGYALSLDQFHGLNQIGETGLRDQVNRHYLQVFGVSLAIGAIAGVEQAGSSYGYSMSGVDAYRRGVSESLSQSAMRILDRYLNILPTFTIREGHRVKVYLSDDLMLPAYNRHRMPANL